MKKKLFKLLTIGSIAAIFGFGIYAYGCASDWWGAGYNSLFSPEITVNNKNYEPFFYDDYTTFYNGYTINQDALNKESVDDWTAYLKKYNVDAVTYYLFDKEINDKIIEISKSQDREAAFKQQEFKYKLDISDKKTQNFLAFIFISRGNEVFSNQTYDYWDYDNRTEYRGTQDFVSRIENFYKTDASNKDAFFKNRIWFQVLRAKFYSDERTSVIAFFDETAKDQPKNTLYYRGLSYVAGAYKSLNNYEKSNALFAEVFNHSEAMMPSALFDYKPLDKPAFENLLKSVSDKSVKETLYALQGYYTNSFEAMQDLYKQNPASKHLDFLLSRWININEQNINIYTGYAQRDVLPKKIKKEIKSKIDATQLKWLNSVADAEKVSNAYMWKSAAAYFNTLAGDYKKATNQLQDAYRLTKNENQKGQVRSLRLLNNLLSTDKMDLNAEAKLIEDANWLFYDQGNVNNWENNRRISYLQEFTKKYISALYQEQNNPLMAELTYSIKGFYKDQKQSEAMERFLLSDKRSAWQDIFVGIYPYKLADIYESRGIYLFYQDKIDEAIAEFEKIPPFERRQYNWRTEKYETETVDYKALELPGNPFNGKIKDCNDCDHQAKQSVKYTMLSFLQKVKEMQGKIKAGDDVYNNALLVGNAFYNASYFGNARAFYYNNIINEYGNSISKEHEKMLYGMENVKKYYALAQKAATNNEQKAKMAYMFAKVERNDFYATNYFMPNEYFYPYGDFVSFKKWQGFEDLQQNYFDTKYYQDVIAECGYFRTYLGIK